MVNPRISLKLRVQKPTKVVSVLSDCIAEGELAHKIEQHSSPFEPGEHGFLFQEGDSPDSVYYLKKGEALLSMHEEGHSILTVRAMAGSILGLPAVIGNVPYSLSANAMQDAEVYRIASSEFSEMIQQNPQLCIEVVRILAAEVRSARTAIIEANT